MRIGVAEVAAEEHHGVVEEGGTAFLLSLEFVYQTTKDAELLGFDTAELGELVRLLAVVGEIVVIDRDAGNGWHGVGTLQEDGDQARGIALQG